MKTKFPGRLSPNLAHRAPPAPAPPPPSLRRNFFLLLFAGYLLWGYGYLALGLYTLIGGPPPTAPAGLDLTGRPQGADFLVFAAAASLARQGDPAAAYSPPRLKEAAEELAGAPLRPLFWNYPPTFLLLLLPLAHLSYHTALAVWLAATLGGYLAVVRRILPPPLAPLLFLAFPPAVANFLYAQNGFLSAALLAGGLLLLDRRPLTAGFLLGFLSYKPQLAIFIPLALAAGRRWRALSAAAAGALALALASLLILGPEPWKTFFLNLPLAAGLTDQPVNWPKMPTVLAAARLAGAGLPLALGLQAAAALGAAAAVLRVWSGAASLPLKAAAILLGTLLGAPYALEYDLALLAPAFAWLGWEEFQARRPAGLDFLLLAWVALFLTAFPPFDTRFQLTPLVLLALLFFTLRRTAQECAASPMNPICLPHN